MVIKFNNAKLNIESNGIYYIFGENGVGKTSLLKILSGLESFRGELNTEAFKDKFLILDNVVLYSNITGYQNIEILIAKKINKIRLDALIKKYCGDDNFLFKKKVKKYSLGQKKKIYLIMVEYLKPKYIFLDEILNGLDIDTKLKFIEFLKEIRNDSVILVSGHEKTYANLCNKSFIISNKTIEEVDPQILINKFKKIEEGLL